MFEDALLNTNYLLSQTKKQQVLASSPKISAWVSANAGAGKTHVLKLRVLRLLLAETLPEVSAEVKEQVSEIVTEPVY